jgi:excisionase family DNA binding protein
MPGDMLTSREVAEYLGIHEKHVYRLLRQGRLPGTRVTGRWIFSRRLLTTDEAFYRKPTQAFFEMVKSSWVRQLIGQMPGYDARETGLLTVVQPD